MTEILKAHEFFESGHIPVCVFRMPYIKGNRLPHSHDFHEIMIVVGGAAVHHMDGSDVPITMGDVFVVPPGHEHSYDVVEHSGIQVVNVLFDLKKLNLNMRDLSKVPGFLTLFARMARGQRQPHLKLVAKDLAIVMSLAEEIEMELEAVEPGCEFFCETKLREMILFMSRRYSHVPPRVGGTVLRMGDLVQFMEQNLGEDIQFKDLVGRSAMSPTTLRRTFNEAFGCSPMNYLQQLRVKKSILLLADPAKSITEVAGEVGFDNPGYFARVFKHETGESPRAFRSHL